MKNETSHIGIGEGHAEYNHHAVAPCKRYVENHYAFPGFALVRIAGVNCGSKGIPEEWPNRFANNDRVRDPG